MVSKIPKENQSASPMKKSNTEEGEDYVDAMTNIEGREAQVDIINGGHQDMQLVDCSNDVTLNIEDAESLELGYLEEEIKLMVIWMCQFGQQK